MWGDRQVAPRRADVTQARHDPRRVVGVAQEVQDREQPGVATGLLKSRCADLRLREQLRGAAHVPLHRDAQVADREQGLAVGDDELMRNGGSLP